MLVEHYDAGHYLLPCCECRHAISWPGAHNMIQGTYVVSSSIVDYYNTMIIGNPNCLPTLKATPNFSGFGVIDGNQYQSGGALGWGATNVFFSQVRNFIIDLTAIPASSSATGIHWPVSQATSLQNIVFKMSDAPGTQHQGIFIESGTFRPLTLKCRTNFQRLWRLR